MKYNIGFFILILIISGCQSNKTKPLKIFEDIDSEKFEQNVQNMIIMDSLPIRIAIEDCKIRKETLLSEWVDSIRFVNLDSSDAALVGSINKLICKDDAIYLLDRYKTKSIKKFSKDGRFLGNVGKYGEAPGEYAEPTDFIINDSLVIVYDQFGCRLSYYTLDGRYLHAKKMPFLCLRFQQYDNEFIFNTLDADNQHMQSIENYSIFKTDSTFKIKERGFYRERGVYSSIISDFNFAIINDMIYYHPPFSGKIFKINRNGTCDLMIHLDFGKKQLPEKYLLNENWKEFQQESDNDTYYFFPGEFLLTSDVVYFSYINQHKVYRCFYSLKDKRTVGSASIKNDMYPIFPFANLIGVEGNNIIGYVYPHHIVEARNKCNPDEWLKIVGEKSVDISKDYKEEDNPILVWFHLKDNI